MPFHAPFEDITEDPVGSYFRYRTDAKDDAELHVLIPSISSANVEGTYFFSERLIHVRIGSIRQGEYKMTALESAEIYRKADGSRGLREVHPWPRTEVPSGLYESIIRMIGWEMDETIID